MLISVEDMNSVEDVTSVLPSVVAVVLLLAIEEEDTTDVGGVLVMGVVTVGVVNSSVGGGAVVSAYSSVTVWPDLGPIDVVWRLHFRLVINYVLCRPTLLC